MLVVNQKKKRLVELIITLLVVLIISFILILNKDIRTIIIEKIKEVLAANTIETKIDYEILPLERRKFKCTYNSRK